MSDNSSSKDADDAIPAPPDLSSLFQQHTQKINDACQQANKVFDAINTRDQNVKTLTEMLNKEVK